MSRFTFLFATALILTLTIQGVSLDSEQEFMTVHDYIYETIEPADVHQSFLGQHWVQEHLVSSPVDPSELLKQNTEAQTLVDKSRTRRYQKSYNTWVEEKTCPESPYIDKPMRATMTSRFGRRFHPLSGRSHVHAGIDFRGKKGTPVLASSMGRVKSVSRKGAYGKAIVLEHGNKYTTLYGHLSGYAVKKGQWVNLGQTIGYVGSTGRATGPHLHFEVRCHNVPLNPNKYLGKFGLSAEVKFKRYRRSLVGQRRTANVRRDPNYYTRMINLEKLKSLKKTN